MIKSDDFLGKKVDDIIYGDQKLINKKCQLIQKENFRDI